MFTSALPIVPDNSSNHVNAPVETFNGSLETAECNLHSLTCPYYPLEFGEGKYTLLSILILGISCNYTSAF